MPSLPSILRPPALAGAAATRCHPAVALPLAVEGAHPGLGPVASLLHLGAAAGAIAVAGFGTLAVASLLAYSKARLRQQLEDQGHADADARADQIDARDDEFLVAGAIATATAWLLGLWAVAGALPSGQPPWALAGFLLGMVWLAGSVPTGLARLRPERTLLFVLPVLHPVWLLLRWPLVLPILAASRLLLRAFRVQPVEPADAAEVHKQVIAAVADTVTEDTLPHAERTWIGNIIALKDLQVSTLMTPRPDIVAFPETMSLRDAVHKALDHGFSRYPVYRDRIDEVIGIFYVKDALRAIQEDASRLADTPLRSMLREVLFMPETTGAAQLLRRFQAGNQHMAIVIDEYGTTVGLVTVEDVLEQIVGDIGDEYDQPTASPGDGEQIRVVESGRVLEVPARTTVAEVNRLLGSELPEEGDWETVAGLVIARLNHIPAVDETIAIEGVEFRVLEADDRRIRRLRATLLSPQPAEGAG